MGPHESGCNDQWDGDLLVDGEVLQVDYTRRDSGRIKSLVAINAVIRIQKLDRANCGQYRLVVNTH
jgi:hypothetical protein